MTRYLAFDIGCIECGEYSQVLGVFKTNHEAQEACNIAQVAQAKDWHGEHHFEVFAIEVPE